jgi:Family of unknown function (DUF6496)
MIGGRCLRYPRRRGPRMPKSVEGVMREYKLGDLHSGSKHGPVVSSHKQAVAIALSEQRQQGKAVPKPKGKR